jgi:hypothetical protein
MTIWIQRSPWWPVRPPRSSPPGCARCCAPARCTGRRVSWRSATRHWVRYAGPGGESSRWPGAARTDGAPRLRLHPGVARLARALAAPGGGQVAGIARAPVAAAVAKRPRAHRERANPHSLAPPGRTCRRSGGQRGTKRPGARRRAPSAGRPHVVARKPTTSGPRRDSCADGGAVRDAESPPRRPGRTSPGPVLAAVTSARPLPVGIAPPSVPTSRSTHYRYLQNDHVAFTSWIQAPISRRFSLGPCSSSCLPWAPRWSPVAGSPQLPAPLACPGPSSPSCSPPPRLRIAVAAPRRCGKSLRLIRRQTLGGSETA